MKSTLPDTDDFHHSTEEITVVYRRSSPSKLKNASYVSGDNSIVLPESILDGTGYLEDTTGKFIDSIFSIHPDVTGA